MSENTGYNHKNIEKKWQKFWGKQKTFQAVEGSKKPKFYVLDMFPYPSGAGLHVGHPEGYTATDIIARYKRMRGFNVLHPMGWDAFGLPAENYAIKTGTHPEITTKENIRTFKRQIQSLGFSYDWSRELSTTDPKYYRWSQWIFLKMYERGLLYEKKMPMNWCPQCKIVAANEEVENGKHERCGSEVFRRNLRQWMFKITEYSEKLLRDLENNLSSFSHLKKEERKSGHTYSKATDEDFQNILKITKENNRNTYHFKKEHFLVLKIHSELAGFCRTHKVDNTWCELSSVHILSKFRGEKLGQQLVREAIRHSPEKEFFIDCDKSLEDYYREIGFQKVEKLPTWTKLQWICEHFLHVPFNLPKIKKEFSFFRYKKKNEELDWPSKIVTMQKNWIGKSEGAEVDFDVDSIPRGEEHFSFSGETSPHIFSVVFPFNKKVQRKEKNTNMLISIIRKMLRKHSLFLAQGAIAPNHIHLVISDPKKREKKSLFNTFLKNFSQEIGELKSPLQSEHSLDSIRTESDLQRILSNIKQQSEKEDHHIFYDSEIVTVYTTRIDTIFSGTFLILAPEHELVKKIVSPDQRKEVEKYCLKCTSKSDLERTELNKEKTGIFTGAYATNPATGEKMPLWISDFVLASYGTGAVFADAHDERDFEMAKKFNIPLKVSLRPKNDALWEQVKNLEICYPEKGILVHSNQFDGLESDEAIPKIVEWLSQKGSARKKIHYKLRDWIFTRQRYWGEPIPLIHCKKCGTVPISPLFRYEEYFKQKKKGTRMRLKPESDTKLGAYVPKTDCSHSVTILNRKLILCKEKKQFLFRYAKNFREAPSEIEGKEKVYIKWNVLFQRFIDDALSSHQEKYTFVNIRAPYRNMVLEAISQYQFSEEKDLYEILALSSQAIVKIVLKRRNGNIYLDTFFPLKSFTKKVRKYFPENILPLTLPKTDSFLPTEDGESPLAKVKDWVHCTCPQCGMAAKRETSTMPNWAGSSWYWLRFMDPHSEEAPWSKESEQYWGPVDLYVGGAEHAVLHLLYSRFWHKVFYDMELVSTKEPFKKLMNQGLILAEDGQKMSKSLGNVINPDDIVEKYGADTLRIYEMFMGPFEQNKSWNTGSVEGMYKFLQRIWRLYSEKQIADSCPGKNFQQMVHKTVKKVTEDIENFKFNTALSQMMIFLNEAQKVDVLPRKGASKFIRLLSPFAPHLAEEIWRTIFGNTDSISEFRWPTWDENLAKDEEVRFAVQVNGKLRSTFSASIDITREEGLSLAKQDRKIQSFLEGKEIVKEIFVPGKIINIVLR
jgi:leucyl-tRNA synthetase